MLLKHQVHTYDNTIQDLSLPEQQGDQSVASGSSLPPSSRRAATIEALAKRARETKDTRRVGRRKRAQTTSMDQSQPSQQNHHSDDMNITMGEDSDNLMMYLCLPTILLTQMSLLTILLIGTSLPSLIIIINICLLNISLIRTSLPSQIIIHTYLLTISLIRTSPLSLIMLLKVMGTNRSISSSYTANHDQISMWRRLRRWRTQ
ncbi:uncharacterized protein F5891DRAFT_254149 [Suillus fuscotomentosus]|uniref:Uncharacterized protein n=1 Tax=Suillus fuscotomentosus TaxID=1912939 RepID=A0AAD4E8A4_9AGAM|nr:uncharacterized protein F5891DRAFT_254149 [Suillus fuscotomentosus]KAG1901400.1 hypothetical protein F5891DRAFT_254149 [Suillus fuscotomentosus]